MYAHKDDDMSAYHMAFSHHIEHGLSWIFSILPVQDFLESAGIIERNRDCMGMECTPGIFPFVLRQKELLSAPTHLCIHSNMPGYTHSGWWPHLPMVSWI